MSHVREAPPTMDGQVARLTLRALAGSALGVLPLLQLLQDTSWLIQAWISMAIVVVPAALLRLRRAPSVVHLVPGIVLLTGYLTRVYLPSHAWLGVVPTRASWSDLQAMGTALGRTVSDSAAPLDSNAPVRLYLSIGLAALAIVIDVLVVELHRPALAGVPLLLIFTLAGAVPRDPVNWLWFALAGAGYLLILSSRTIDDLRSWGRVVARPERTSGSSRLTSALSGRRIGLVAIIVAVLVPFVLPLGSANVLANALHNGQVGVGGNGKGSTGVVIDPLAVLRGQLTRSAPLNLFTVDVTGAGAKSAFYLRTAVLENYTGKAWMQGPAAATVPATGNLTFSPTTFGSSVQSSPFSAKVTVSKLGGTPPVFGVPSQLSGIPGGWSWSSRYGVVAGNVSSGTRYTEAVAQPDPSIATLESSPSVRRGGLGSSGNAVLQDNLTLPPIPSVVSELVRTITNGKTTPYDQARALSTYFTDPADGFVYSLQTKGGESGNDLVDFLTTGKAGFCQQYAAALGVMLRVAGIPARVVLGYTHPAPDASGRFEVTSDDAHAWVEAYFTGVGWLPFDPTPLTGADAARAVALPWAPHPTVTGGAAPQVNPRAGEEGAAAAAAAAGQNAGGAASQADDAGQYAWMATAAFVLLALIVGAVPGLLRVRRRRGRVHRSRLMGPEPLWDELADTTLDLGLGWSTARSTRQVAVWLGEHVRSQPVRDRLRTLAGTVERGRYAAGPPGGPPAGWSDEQQWRRAVDEVAAVRRDLMGGVSARTRWRARLLPASLWKSHANSTGPMPADTPRDLAGRSA